MARAGRKRKFGAREANGRIQRKSETAWTPQIIERRAALVGKENALDPKAGEALGVLLHRGVIDQRQYDVGRAFGCFYRSWRAMAGARSPWETPIGDFIPDGAPADAWQKARDRMRDVLMRINGLPRSRLVRAALETFVIDDEIPPVIEAELRRTGVGQYPMSATFAKAAEALRSGLEVLAAVFVDGRK